GETWRKDVIDDFKVLELKIFIKGAFGVESLGDLGKNHDQKFVDRNVVHLNSNVVLGTEMLLPTNRNAVHLDSDSGIQPKKNQVNPSSRKAVTIKIVKAVRKGLKIEVNRNSVG
ncbi:hypothetical protein ACLOJK_037398, partial [Asimina triloba]